MAKPTIKPVATPPIKADPSGPVPPPPSTKTYSTKDFAPKKP